MKFDAKASSYTAHASVQESAANWCAEWLGSDYFGKTALELGAGTGFFTRHLVGRKFRRVIATDRSSNMIDEGAKSIDGADWKLMDAWDPEPIKVDGLFSTSLLQWASNPLSVLRKWRSLLKADGEFLFSLFILGSLEEFTSADERFSAVRWLTVDSLLEYLKQAEYSISRYEVKEERMHFSSAREALHSLHDIGAVEENRMTASELSRFLDRCDQKYASPFPLTWKICRIAGVAG